MPQIVKTNTKKTDHPAMVVTADNILRNVVQSARAARTAALQLVCSCAVFLINVNHFHEPDTDGFMNRDKAITYLKDQIAAQAHVKGGMLDIYVSRADALYSAIKGSVTKFAGTIKHIGDAKDADTAVKIMMDWLEDNWKITSLADLSKQLGYKTGNEERGGDNKLTPQKAVERIENTFSAISKITGAGAGHIPEKTVAQAVALQVSNKLVLAREAVRQINNMDDLDALEKVIGEQRNVIKKLEAEAKEAAKKAGKGSKTAAVKGKGKGATHTTA